MSENSVFDSVFAQLEQRNAMGSIQPTLRVFIIEWSDVEGFPSLKIKARDEREAVAKAARFIGQAVAELQAEQPQYANDDDSMFDRCFPFDPPAFRILNSSQLPAIPENFQF